MLGSLLDRALDFAVVPGYSRIGYALRSVAFRSLPSMAGQTVLVTGATSGLGRATAQGCLALGARVVVLARDARKAERTRHELAAATGNDDVGVVVCDLSSLRAVRAAADAVLDAEPALHGLVNNAGVMPPRRTLSEDGIELAFAVNVVAPWLLTQRLLGRLAESAAGAAGGAARVVTVTSGGIYAQALDVGDLQTSRREYDPAGAYARTKRAEVVLTERWARDWAGRGVVAHAVHPGWAATPGVAESLPRFGQVVGPLLRTPAEGADTAVWLLASPAAAQSTGRLWHDRRPRPVDRVPWTRTSPGDAERLWNAVAALAED